MPCPKCKKKTASTWSFCPYCGAELPSNEKLRRGRIRGKGEGSAFREANGKWVAQRSFGVAVNHKTGKAHMIYVRKHGFDSKKAALEALPLLQPPHQDKPDNPTMQQIFDGWKSDYTRRGRKEKTLNGYISAYAYFSDLHDVPFADIGIDDLQEALDDCPHGKRTRQLMKNIASLMYKYAIPRRVTKDDTNLAEYLFCAGDSGKAKVRFSTEELQTLQQAIGKTPYAEYIFSNCYLGYRPSEFCNLDCANYHTDGNYFTAGAKTAAGKNRAMTISPKIMPYVTAAIDGRTEGPVWRNEHGDKMSYDQWRDAFNCTLESLGIPTSAHPAPDGRYLTPHCCRHTARSLMDHAAGTEHAKMALIGHASDEMSKLYTHQELRDLKEVTDSM